MELSNRNKIIAIISSWLIFSHLTIFIFSFNQLKWNIESPHQFEYFPYFLNSPVVFSILFFVLLICDILILVTRFKKLFSILIGVTSYILLISSFGFFIQSLLTTFWASLFLVWICFSCDPTKSKSLLLSQIIISFIFLCSLMGKLTPEFWSGEIFYNLNFPRFDNSKVVSKIFSRSALISEGIITLAFVSRKKIVIILQTVLILGMWIITDPKIIDALGPLFGLSLANIFMIYSDTFKRVSIPKIFTINFFLWLFCLYIIIPSVHYILNNLFNIL